MSAASDAATLQMYLGIIAGDNRNALEVEQSRASTKRDDDFIQGLLDQAKDKSAREIARDDKLIKDKKDIGESSRGGFVANLQRRVSRGSIDENTAQTLLNDFYDKYGIAPSATELDSITTSYETFAPKRREVDLTSLYQNNLGRLPTAAELGKGQADLGLGRTAGDLEKDLQATSEYKNKNPSSIEESKLWLQYGKPISDATGVSTGTYKYDFGGGTLPELSADIIAKTGISKPDFIGKVITDTPAKLEEARKSRDSYESYVYNSGLKALAGDIDKEKLKLSGAIQTGLDKQQIEGQIKVGRQQGQYSLLQGLTGAFNF